MDQTQFKYHVGIDVAKNTFDASIDGQGNSKIFPNNLEGFEKLGHLLHDIKTECVVIMEATGGYEKRLVDWLMSHSIAVAVVNAKRVRDFAKAMGQLAKNDQIDAQIIRQYGEVADTRSKLQLMESRSEQSQLLESLNRRRAQLLKLITQETQHLETANKSPVRDSIERTLKKLKEELEEVEKALAECIAQDEVLHQKQQILASAKGVGQVTANILLGGLPEIGQVNHKEIVALAGLAPYCADSGEKKGKRFIWGGRAQVRSALYMAALSARRWNPAIKQFYDRLISKGKKPKVALVACMRKLLVVLNSLLKKGQLWEPQKM